MKKLTKIKKKGSKSLYGSFLYMTLLPLFLFGIVTIVFSSKALSSSIQTEVSNNLKNVSRSVLIAYDRMYPGDYNIVIDGDKVLFYKGIHLLSEDYTLIDNIREQTGVEVSLFFYDTRLLTTISNREERFVNTGANPQIVDEVIKKKSAKFYNNVNINGVPYFAYYEPVFSQDGEVCIGMIGTAKPAEKIEETINSEIYKNIAIMMLALLLTAAFILRFASNIVMVIKKMMEFLKEMSLGNLSTQLSPVVVNREDELGEMGNFTVKVQASLRKLIERDVLTGLYNRRSGENMLDKVKAGGMTYAVAIGDIDFFKKFNDNFGHDCGDVVLKEVAAVLDNGMRGIGFVARWGGEEFLLVFDNMNGLAAGVEADRILQMVRENTVRYNGQEHTVTMTFGVAEGNAEKPINIQIKEADEKLYRGKESGRNRVIV